MTNYERILQFVEESSVHELRSLTRHELTAISGFLSPTQFQNFMFAKNVKIFGGINGYVNDMFDKDTVERVFNMPNGNSKTSAVRGLQHSLEKMLTYNDLTETNRGRVQNAILLLSGAAAPAAGGMRARKIYRGSRKANVRRRHR